MHVSQDIIRRDICMVFGIAAYAFYHRTVVGVEARKWTGTIPGLALIVYVLGIHSVHHIIAVVSTIALIKSFGWRKCHTVALVFFFTYTTIFRAIEIVVLDTGHPNINLIQMMAALKLVAVGYDIHLTNKAKEEKKSDDAVKPSKHDAEEPIDPSFMDLFHYVFSYTGMFTGPFTRYRTWDDYIKLPFAKSCKFWGLVKTKLPYMIPAAIGCDIIGHMLPLEYILDDEFATSHFLYKSLFNLIQLWRFKMLMTSTLQMSQCIASVLGLGAYPVSLKSESGNGPTKDYSHLKNISQEEADQLEYDFETVHTIDVHTVISTSWQSDYWKAWNRTVQFFMAKYIHTELLDGWKPDMRIFLTFLFCGHWHGNELGQYLSLGLFGVYIVAEKPYFKKIYKKTTGWVSTAVLVVMWIIQALIFPQLMMAYLLLESKYVIIHLMAMNFVPYILLLIFFLIGRVLLKCVK